MTPATVRAAVLDTSPHDGVPADSDYVETFWLPVLGPTTWAVLRHIHARCDQIPGQTVDVDIERLARTLGVAGHRAHRAFARCGQVRLARLEPVTAAGPTWLFPRLVRLCGPKDLRRLPDFIAASHEGWSA